MLPNHAPLVIAEQYGMLDALAPDWIDLGLGPAAILEVPAWSLETSGYPGAKRLRVSASRQPTLHPCQVAHLMILATALSSPNF